jgi:predicted amino acid dehydrogenase
VALHAVEEARIDGVALTIGWGAMTKVATGHGKVFFDRHPELVNEISTTHGDAGTTSLVMSAIRSAGLNPGFKVSVIGANGAIGEAVSRALAAQKPSSIMLVGKPDKEGETKNRDRLNRLADSIRMLSPADCLMEVLIHQDKSKACHEHQSDLVIVATTGMDLVPNEIPKGTLVMDMTTPSACQYHPDWSDERLVLTTGCGQMHHSIIPNLFGFSGIEVLSDVGAGGEHVLWGCTGETIVRAVYGWSGHIVGQDIPMTAVDWCSVHFARLGFYAEPPVSFGRELFWNYVRLFVKYSASDRGVERKSPAVR